jgi:hypothetical protein
VLLDHTRISHLWVKDLPTVTNRGNVAGIHDALVGLGSELGISHDIPGAWLHGVTQFNEAASDTSRASPKYAENSGAPRRTASLRSAHVGKTAL